VVAVLVLAVTAAGCEYFGKSKANNAPAAPPPPVVQVIEVSLRDVMLQSEWVAQTYSQDAVEVRARVNGYIEERRFNAGNLVKQGDILYKLDDRPYKAQVDKANGDLGQKQADLQFAKEQVQVLEAQALPPGRASVSFHRRHPRSL
jgi:multidrug efflux pump subunit AcrA (membrane-fusion protein)